MKENEPNIKESEAFNVPVPMEDQPLDVEKYKHLLKVATHDEEPVRVRAQRPQLHRPMEEQGVQLMSRIIEISCPHCGELAGRFHMFHRLAASETETETSEEKKKCCSNKSCKCDDKELTLAGIKIKELGEASTQKYEDLWKEVSSSK